MISLTSIEVEHEYLMSKIENDIMNRIEGIMDFNEVKSKYSNIIQQLMSILKEIYSIRRMYIDKIDSELNRLYREFKKYAIIINVIGLIPLGLGIIVSIPLTFAVYKTWYLPRKRELEDNKRLSIEELNRLEKRYDEVLDQLVNEIYRAKGIKYEVPKETIEEISFKDVYDLIIQNNLEIDMIRCPNCGKKLEMPLEGTMFKCPRCGFIVKATDIYYSLKTNYLSKD